MTDFLKNGEKSNQFDVDVAINVCRSACIEQALKLAKWHKKHDACLSILIDDMKAYEDALKYIEQLSFMDAEANMKKYGSTLMENASEKTIKLLKKLCTDYVANTDSPSDLLSEIGVNVERGNPEDFINLFSDSDK